MVKQIKTVRLTPEDLKELERLAEKEERTTSFLIQKAIREFIKRAARKRKK
jgi:predicted transcriptional regulator